VAELRVIFKVGEKRKIKQGHWSKYNFFTSIERCKGVFMTISLWCVLVAGIMPMLWAACAKASGPGFDNNGPRDFLEGLTGARKRAHWAQLNSFEAFPLFAVAVIVAHMLGKIGQETIDNVAILFVVSRVFYGVFYIKDFANMRSIVWFVGLVCCISLFVMSV
jgi:uncharacterized MAPEG superfamily protein